MVTIACPLCGRHMTLGRTQGPSKEIHASGGRRRFTRPCRLVLTPDPDGPEVQLSDNTVEVVPHDTKVEDVVQVRRAEWETRYLLVRTTTVRRTGTDG